MVSTAFPISDKYFTRSRWLEFMLTIAVCGFLINLAEPLGAPTLDHGLDQRYGSVDASLSWIWVQTLYANYAWTSLPQDQRAIAMLRMAGYWLALLGASGWLGLQLARTGAAWAGYLVMALWAMLAWLLRPFQLPGVVWVGTVAFAFFGMLVALSRNRKSMGGCSINAWTAAVWPGWLLLTGAGCLVLMDFAARGPVVPNGMLVLPVKPGSRYFGLNQADGLWVASGLLVLSAYFHRPLVRAFIWLCTKFAALWQRPRGPLFLLGLASILTFALGWLGASQHRNVMGLSGLHGAGKPHISSELLRLCLCVTLAWFAYRFGEWTTSSQRMRCGMWQTTIMLTLLAIGFGISDDKGPLLVMALAAAILMGIPALWQISGSYRNGVAGAARRGAAVLFAISIAIAGLSLWRTTLVDWLPLVSADATSREFLRTNPFEAKSPNLAQARWLMESTPADGFGLARVPYCGARAYAGQLTCSLGSGAPLQMPSDFAFVPLFATWGTLGASALVIGTLLWLAALPLGMLASWRKASSRQPTCTIGLLPVWLVAVPALVAQAQIVVSTGATMGWSSLTGVTLPLLGYGSAALCAAAAWVGLAATGFRTKKTEPDYLKNS
jgi:cell division protein FtsW (lipid II flippase)